MFLISEFSLYLYCDHLVAEHVPQEPGDILMSYLPKQFYVALHLCGMLRAWLGKLIVNHDRLLVVAHDAVRSLLYGRPVGGIVLEDGALVIEFPSWAKPLGHGGIGE